MATDRILGLLGLARRAGKLQIGEAPTAETVLAGKARAIFLAGNTGEATRRKVMRHDARVPVFTLPHDKETLGASLGFPDTAVCCVTDVGMARALGERLAELSEANAQAARRVTEKEQRIASRKGIKKEKKADAKPVEIVDIEEEDLPQRENRARRPAFRAQKPDRPRRGGDRPKKPFYKKTDVRNSGR